MGNEYFMGLDIGTGSVGWAVTDTAYNVMRKHGKSLWGTRLFETANTAEERRMFRTSRRRLDRRNQRIQILQELFAEEINEVDPGFFLRMKESKYMPEDKRDLDGKCPQLPYALFVDKDYTDKEYHKQFPTIYHLRKWLMETEETPDIRLVYLALHHIVKHRGHFLLAGNMENIKEFRGTLETFLLHMRNEEIEQFGLHFDNENIDEIEKILKGKLSRSVKKSQLIKVTGAKSNCEKAVCSLLSGCTTKLSDIFMDVLLDECERPRIAFSDAGYDDYISIVEADLGEHYVVIEAAKAVYDWSVLVNILGEHSSISEAKVALYEKHAYDLAYLKKTAKECLTDKEYKELFVITSDKIANYPAYIGMTKKNGKKVLIQGKQASKEEFYDYLKKKVLEKLGETESAYIQKEIEKGTFMPKAVNKDNSVLPQQVHAYELKKILENLEDRIPILKQEEEKLIQLFEFRIPYYIGPVAVRREGENSFSWAVRKTNDKIYPWNFEEVIDAETSAEQFIRRMTNKCTYLMGKDVLPKDSLLYSKFMVLNELNNLRLDGELISVELKQKIYDELFKRCRKVTQKKLKDYLCKEGIISKEKIVEITGIDGDFKSSLTAYHDFKEKLTSVVLSEKEKEEIILNIALFGDDKSLLKKRLKKMFPNLTEGQIKGICSLNYSGWGKLSREFLEEVLAPALETGEAWNLITALWETNENLMQLLSEKYLFGQALEDMNQGDSQAELTYQTVDDMYVSPAVKRQIWQTIKIVNEIKNVMGAAPKRIFVEMAREKQESKRTETRKKQLIELYKKCKLEERDWITELTGKADHELRNDRLYLYYTQKGRCMYSGEIIGLEDLWDDNKYDIDHIYPQSKVMDDSLDNRVLVKKELNAEKSDIYPIRESIRNTQCSFWKSLLDDGFISKEKFHRLTRCNPFDNQELAGFIQRQLVETRQSTKAVADILKKALPETEIVYTKAKSVSKFRQDYELIKVRELNDLHHAKDAYLNIVVGNTYFLKFTKHAAWFIEENPGRSYNLQKMFKQHDVKRNGEVGWICGANGTIVTVKKQMGRNDILVTRKSYEVKGGLFDQMLMKKGKGQVAIKGSDDRLGGVGGIQKYGGYNKATGAYFMLIESLEKKGNKIRTIEYVPLYLKKKIEESDAFALEYLAQDRGLVQPRICLRKIKTDTLFDVDGFKMWLSGRTGNQLIFKGANQLLLTKEETGILKNVLKYVRRVSENKNLKLSAWDHLTADDLIALYDTFLHKLEKTVYGVRLGAQVKTLSESRDKFIDLSDEEKCIVLSEVLHMFQCNSVAANLSMLGGPGKAGILVMNNNITKCNRIKILHQSTTGIKAQEIDLLKV